MPWADAEKRLNYHLQSRVASVEALKIKGESDKVVFILLMAVAVLSNGENKPVVNRKKPFYSI